MACPMAENGGKTGICSLCVLFHLMEELYAEAVRKEVDRDGSYKGWSISPDASQRKGADSGTARGVGGRRAQNGFTLGDREQHA